MKIALLSTPWIATPPKGYGGIELVVANLAEQLIKKNHDVYLFATGDSKTKAKLFFYFKKALGNNFYLKQIPYLSLLHISEFLNLCKNEKFDIIHNNFQYPPMFFLDSLNTPFIHTLHGAFYKNLLAPYLTNKISVKWVRETLKRFKHHPFVSISNNQRTGLPELNYVKTIYNGIKIEEFSLGEGDGGYLAWLGRVTPNKGLDIAIEVAQKTKLPLKIAGFIDPGDQKYFDEVIKPKIKAGIYFMKEITDSKEKSKFFEKAIATLFPIRWHEPFGIVMVESMACGTPVVAFNKGSAPEVIKDGQTGFIVENLEQMIGKVKEIKKIERKKCRDWVLEKFTVEKMTNDYLEAYQKAIELFPYQ